jgi:hypothetical protein
LTLALAFRFGLAAFGPDGALGVRGGIIGAGGGGGVLGIQDCVSP